MIKLLEYFTVRICQIKQWLNCITWKHVVLLPQIEDPNDFAFFILRTLVKMIEGNEGVFSEAGGEHVLVRPELMPALSHYRVNHIDPGDFIFLFTFLDEFLHTLHNMFVKLDRPNS